MSSKNRDKIVIFLLLAIIVVGGIISYKNLTDCSDIETIYAEVVVKTDNRNVIGLNADRNNLTFGTISPGSVANKQTVVRYSEDAEVEVSMLGEITEFIGISPNKFYLLKGEQKEVSFDVYIPDNTPNGMYKGKAVFCFK